MYFAHFRGLDSGGREDEEAFCKEVSVQGRGLACSIEQSFVDSVSIGIASQDSILHMFHPGRDACNSITRHTTQLRL